MELVSLKCPHCSAMMSVDEEHMLVKCPYCGEGNLYVEDKEITLKRLDIKEKELEMKKEEDDREHSFSDFITEMKMFAVVFLFGVVVLLIFMGFDALF